MSSLLALAMLGQHQSGSTTYSSSNQQDKWDCEAKYPFTTSSDPIFISIVLTLFIIFLAAVIEVRTRLYQDEPPREAPSPICRANRFAGVTVAMIPMCIAFHFRVKQIQASSDGACAGKIAVAEWPLFLILIFNILPFVCACTVWLRTLVDCVLVRFNKTVSDKYWTYAFPISSLFLLLGFLNVLIREAALRLMVVSGGNVDTLARPHRDDVEMGHVSEDETQNLMQDDGLSTREDDEITIYNPQTSVDGKPSP